MERKFRKNSFSLNSKFCAADLFDDNVVLLVKNGRTATAVKDFDLLYP